MLTTACASQFPLTGCVVKLAAQFVLSLNLAIGSTSESHRQGAVRVEIDDRRSKFKGHFLAGRIKL